MKKLPEKINKKVPFYSPPANEQQRISNSINSESFIVYQKINEIIDFLTPQEEGEKCTAGCCGYCEKGEKISMCGLNHCDHPHCKTIEKGKSCISGDNGKGGGGGGWIINLGCDCSCHTNQVGGGCGKCTENHKTS